MNIKNKNNKTYKTASGMVRHAFKQPKLAKKLDKLFRGFSWNYRIIKSPGKIVKGVKIPDYYYVSEVYFDKVKGKSQFNRPWGWTTDCRLGGESANDIREQLKTIINDVRIDVPILVEINNKGKKKLVVERACKLREIK